MNTRLQNKIDEYHSGRMSADELHSFEKELASDPSLQAESDFQSDIINGLKEFRKKELKTRLDAVDIGPVWFEFVQQSTLLKSFGGVAVATLVGTGVYFMAEPKPYIDSIDNITIDAPKETLPRFTWNIEPASINQPQKIAGLAKPTISATLPAFVDIQADDIEEASSAPKEDSFSLDFNAPIAEDIKDEEALEISSLDVLPKNSTSEEEAKPIDVDHESTKSLDIKYKYYDGKLFLSGDFDRAPYEILEINSADGRRIYVKYLDKYYSVGTTDRLTALPEVKNVEVIKELDLLRQNK